MDVGTFPTRFPVKGLLQRGYRYRYRHETDIDVDVNIDSDMTVSINSGSLKRGLGLLERGLVLIEGRLRADPCKNYVAESISW